MITLVNCIGPNPIGNPGIPPPGLLSLAASVRQAGFAVRLADLASAGDEGPPAPEDFPKWLGEISPVVGFSTMSNMLPYALEAARYLRESSPHTTIIFGGCGVQAAVNEILERFPAIDYAFQGESEYTLPEFLRHRRNPNRWPHIKGLAYRHNGCIVANPPPPRIKNLDDLPPLAFDLVDFANAYKNYSVGVQTSRGCPFACTYCEGSVFRRDLFATHSIKRILKDIKDLQAHYPITRIGLIDDTFTVHKERAAEFCRQYIAGRNDFQWGICARVDGIDVPLMKRLSESQCGHIYFGVESGSNKILSAIRKGVTCAQIYDIVPRAKDFFPDVIASFMWGFPFEELADLEETLMLAAYLRTFGIDNIQLHLWSPMPRSPLFKQFQNQLVYDPEIQSNMVLGDVSRYEHLIASHSTIFAPFYHVPHPDFERKKKMISDMGFSG